MDLLTFTLISFAIGIGLWAVVDHPGIKNIAKWVGGLGGILFGLVQLFNILNK